MVEGNTPTAEWPVFNLQRLEQAIAGAKTANKYLFIWDKQGSVATFMQYKGQLCSLAPEVVKVALQRQTAQDVGEVIRKEFINGMRNGENLCIDIDKSVPDFASYNSDGTFDANLFFNWAEFNQEANHMPFVRENENHGIGGINPGNGYARSANFCGIIRSGVEGEEALQEQIAKIPNFNTDFHHVVIS